MFLIESFLLALALCVDSLVVSTTSAFKSKMSYRRGLLMAVVFAFFQGLFPLLGALLGTAFKDVVSALDHWIAFGLLLAVGGKMIWDGIAHDPSLEKQSDINSPSLSRRGGRLLWQYFLLGIATSIDAFAVGIGLGLDNPVVTVLWVVALIGVVTFMVSQVGVFFGKRNIPVPERAANIIAGVVLVGLGVKILLEHLLC